MSMARVVVVASSDVATDVLEAYVAPDDELHVVVPAVEQSRLQWLANDEDGARARAEAVGEEIGRTAPTVPVETAARPDAPSQVVRDAIAEHGPDRVLLVVRGGEDATWLETGEDAQVPPLIDGVPVYRISV
jgi:hypothetical protein